MCNENVKTRERVLREDCQCRVINLPTNSEDYSMLLQHTSSVAVTVSVNAPSRRLIVIIVSIVLCMQLPPSVKSSCPTLCLCRWKGGKETTECVDKGLTAIPSGIDGGTQVLELTGNNLQVLPREAFLRSGLLNLQRLHLARCNLAVVDAHAFSRLANLIDLDLNQNRLTAIPTDSFVNIPELRRLVLSGNVVSRIEANAFAHLKSLITLELTNCIIEVVDDQAFSGLPVLQQLKLNGNRLRTLSQNVLTAFKSLTEVLLTDNPWTCDCDARDFRQWLLKSEVPYYISPQCNMPQRLKGFDLDKLPLDDFACAPTGGAPDQLVQVQQGSNVTLECRVTADPGPFVHWLFRDTVLTNGTSEVGSVSFEEEIDGRTYWVDESESEGNDKVSALFLGSVDERDVGHYVCVAENRGGRYLVNFTLEVTRLPVKQIVPVVVNRGFVMGLSIGIGVFALLVVALVCLLLIRFCCCASNKRHKLPRSETQDTKDSSAFDSPSDPINDKCSMLQPTNPIQKPPRSFNNATYVSTSPISLHDYDVQRNSDSLSNELIEFSTEPQGSVFSIKPDIIKVDSMGEYSVPRNQHLNGNVIRPNLSSNGNAIYHNTTGRWNSESPIASCHGCGDHTTSCLGVPCLHGSSSYAGEMDTESDHSSYRANVRPTASGLHGDNTAALHYNDQEWPRPPPPLYDTIKQQHPVPVASMWNAVRPIPPRIDERYELLDYGNGESSGGSRPVWERQSPTTAATAAAAIGISGSSSSNSGGGSNNFPDRESSRSSTNVLLKESVPALTPFPLLNLSTVRDSPDEGYEDEGDEGTEV